MATVITSECINCGACEPECPNTAIYQGGVEYEVNGVMHPPLANDFFYIVPEKCTECVGFHDKEACAAVCPVDCCIPDPAKPEAEDVLLARAKVIHPDQTFPADFPSRFKGSRTASAPAPAPAAAAPSPAPAPAAVAAPAPVAAPEPPAAAAPPPAAAVVPEPPAAPAAATVAPAVPSAAAAAAANGDRDSAESGLSIAPLDDWEIPLECHGCHGTFAVPFKHFHSGVVLKCPFCSSSYVINTKMYAQVSEMLRPFHARWIRDSESFHRRRQRELNDFETRQRSELAAFTDTLKRASLALRPSGAEKKPAGFFG